MTLSRHVTHGIAGARPALFVWVLLTALAVAGFYARPASAATVYVSTSGNDGNPGTQAAPFADIQTAFNNVASGDTVELEPGTYSGPGDQDLDMAGKSLTVMSSSGSATNTIINCAGSSTTVHRGFYFHTSEANAFISNITIEDGYEATDAGGGVDVALGCTVTMTGCILSADTGSGVNNAGTVTLNNCTFSGNTAAGSNGGGLINSGLANVNGGTFTGNMAGSGGAIYNSGTLNVSGSTTFGGSTTNANVSTASGGAIYNTGPAIIDGATFTDNATTGSGGAVYNTGTATLTNCTLTSNTATAGGGGIGNTNLLTLGTQTLTANGYATSSGCTLTGNVSNTTGGGIQNAGNVTVSATMFNGNQTKTGAGGGLYDTNAGGATGVTYQGTLTNCTFVSNSATGGNGGGLYSNSALTVVNSTFTANNVATGSQGGGVENDGTGEFVNNIIYLNTINNNNSAFGAGLAYSTSPTVYYSDIQGGFNPQNDNINANPEFIYNPGTTGYPYGDLQLQSTSPCLGMGADQTTVDNLGLNNVSVPANTIDNNPPVTRPDPPAMGAYELGFSYPTPTISSIVPSTVTLNPSAPFVTLTINGTGFEPTTTGATVSFNGTTLSSASVNYVSSTKLIVTVSLTTAGSMSVYVTNPTPGGGQSNTRYVTVNNPVPTINTNGISTSPNPATTGSGLTLTINGTNFLTGSTVSYNGTTLPSNQVNYVSPTQLTATILTASNTAGTFAVTVTNPTPGGGTSNSENVTVVNPAPTISSGGLSPSSAVVGTGFTLTVTGTHFVSGVTQVYFIDPQGNSTQLTPTISSSTTLTVTVPASASQYSGTATVTVTNPAPTTNGANASASASASFTVNPRNPAPTIGSVSTSPTPVTVGTGFTLTVTGSGFNSTTTVTFGSTPLTISQVAPDGTTLTATVPASAVTTAGSVSVTVTNPPTTTTPSPDGGTATETNAVTVDNPVPAVISLSPTNAIVGTPFTLVVTGTGFDSATTMSFGTTPLTISSESGIQLVATVPAIANNTIGPVTVTVTNPAPTTLGASTSASATGTFTVNATNPAPTIASTNGLSPSSALVNTSFTLTVNGTNFLPNSTLTFNGVQLTITSQSATTLTATVPAVDNPISGPVPVTVTNPAPGGGSTTQNFTVNATAPVLTITNINPTSATVGTSIPLTVTGSNFTANTTLTFTPNGGSLTTLTAQLSSDGTTLTATVPASANTATGAATVTATDPTYGTASDTIAINAANTVPAPSINTNGLSPSSAVVGTSIPLTITGTNLSGSTLTFGGTTVVVTNISSDGTTLTATVPASANQTAGSVNVKVTTAGGSAQQTFTVNATNPAPTVTSVSPTSATVGNGFTLTVNGTNFTSNTTLSFGGTALTVTSQTSTTLTATVPASANQTTGSVTVTVTNPAPGGGSATGTVSVSTALTILHTFPAGLQMISLPENYASVSSLADVWSAPSGQQIDTWDGGPNYVTTSITSPSQLPFPGEGAWVDFGQATTLYDTGSVTSASGSAVVALALGWNMIGNPFVTSSPISESDLEVATGAGTLTLSQANTEAVVSSTIYTYQAGDTAYEQMNLSSGTLAPYEGYWVYAFQPCSLVFPAQGTVSVRTRR